MEKLKVLKAIHNVQQSLEIIGRTSTAKIEGNRANYSYKYTSMATIWLELKPLLKREGLTIIQAPSSENGSVTGDFLTTTIYHESGEAISTTSRLIITRDDPQGYGSAITYARRYALVSILGIITDDDNDATTQRLADGEMKKEWVRAYTIMAKKVDPDHQPTNAEFIAFMTDTYGKHPSRVLAKEHQNVLDTINAFNQ